jgi:hypothetical protein
VTFLQGQTTSPSPGSFTRRKSVSSTPGVTTTPVGTTTPVASDTVGRSLSPASVAQRRASLGDVSQPALHKELAQRVVPYLDQESRRLYSPVAAAKEPEVRVLGLPLVLCWVVVVHKQGVRVGVWVSKMHHRGCVCLWVYV